MKTLTKLIARLYIACLMLSIIPLTTQAQKLSDVIIIKVAYIDRLNDAQVGDTIDIKLSDGRLFTLPFKLTATMQADNEWTASYDMPMIKGTLIINKQGTDIRGYIRLEETDYVYILDSFKDGNYIFKLKPINELLSD